MLYLCIVLIIAILYMAARLLLLKIALKETSRQMSAIEENPESNRQLKALTAEKNLEKVLKKINAIYQARQEERIVYQRRETQIRREIENISHDLRTPLTVILGYVELIQNDAEGSAEKEEYLDTIKHRARVLQGFIEDFYELSRIEGENYPMLLETVSIQSSIAEIAVTYYLEFEKRGIQVELELDKKPCTIIADRIMLTRIINNLIQNALKYAVNQFQIRQYIQNNECILQFMNEKGKLTDNEMEVIFDRFYSGDTSRSNNSSGLGLTISKLLTQKMKGTIQARLEGKLFIVEVRFPMPRYNLYRK